MAEASKPLVQNLRAYQAIMGRELTLAGTPWKLAGEAADELERLQEAVSTLESTYRYECSQVERLRAALGEAVAYVDADSSERFAELEEWRRLAQGVAVETTIPREERIAQLQREIAECLADETSGVAATCEYGGAAPSPWRPGSVRHGMQMVKGGLMTCAYCGFALITEEPRQCCTKGRSADAECLAAQKTSV